MTLPANGLVGVRVQDAAESCFMLAGEAWFSVERIIARGGSSLTYRAVLHALEAAGAGDGVVGGLPAAEPFESRVYAVKVVDRADLAANEWAHLKEFRAMSVLPMPYAFGPELDECGGATGKWAIVMEFIAGTRLDAYARAWGDDHGGAPLPLETVLDVMNPVMDFVAMISSARPPLVHRDIKPENIILEIADGRMRSRLIDLGIAERAGDRADADRLMGTYGFAAPEIIEACDRDAVHAGDPRVDTFGLAATLHYALGGGVFDYVWRGAFPLAHASSLVADVRDRAGAYVRRHFGIECDVALVEAAVADAFEELDAQVADALRIGLGRAQAERPVPSAFVDLLPRHRLAASLERMAVVHCLERLSRHAAAPSQQEGPRVVIAGLDVQDTTLADGLRYAGFERDFVEAMDAWNRGSYDEAVPLLGKLADAGDATSQYNLGICIRDGLGGAVGEPESVVWWWTEAARSGHIVAMYNIGLCLEEGYGVPESAIGEKAALAWFERAAAKGFPLAEKRLEAAGQRES